MSDETMGLIKVVLKWSWESPCLYKKKRPK